MTKRQKIIRYLFVGIALTLTLTYCANRSIKRLSKEFITSDIKSAPKTKVGLLLGTTRALKNGMKNDFFYNRINAAVELFKHGNIKYIIVSGDNGKTSYNEPLDMKNELVKLGIPDSLIYLDYAGFRTLDSVVRAREIFGQTCFIIISQEFHTERAVYIARKRGIEAYGYNAKDVTAYKGFKTKIREYFARDKVFLDILLGVEPKFLGEKVLIK